MMKKTVALLAVAGLAAATSDFQDDYLALRLTNHTKTNHTTPIRPIRANHTQPIKPIRPLHPVKPSFPTRDRVTISTKNLTREERAILERLARRTDQPRRPVHRPTNATNSTKPAGPKKPTYLARDDDEFFAEDDEFFAEDDEFFAEDDEFYAEDDFFYAEDDEFFAKNGTKITKPTKFNHTKPVVGKPLVKPFPIKTNSTVIPRPRPGMIRPNSTVNPRPRPGMIHRPRVNGTAVHRPRVNTTKPAKPTQTKPTKLPIKPTVNTTKALHHDDDEFFAEDDEFFADEDEFWVDIDDEFFAEDDEFYAEDDEFYAEDDEFYAEDDEFYAEDDEFFVDADDDFFAARLQNRTHTAKPARNSTLGRLDALIKESKKDLAKFKNATKPAVKELKHDVKNLTSKGKEIFKNATKPAAPKKGFLSMF